jgi:hypothetical protein
MSYRPEDHTFGGSQVIAAWIVCLCIIGLALGVTAGHAANLAGMAASQAHAAILDPCPSAGIRVPQFAACSTAASLRSPSVQASRGTPSSLPHDCS